MKKIREMSVEEMRDELGKFCKGRPCGSCPLCLMKIFSDDRFEHGAIGSETDLYKLALMLEIARGGLVWAAKEFDNGSNVPDQPTIPPMPEPVELPEAKVSELSVDVSANVPDDMTVIMISGKKPAMMTTYFDQPAD